MKSLRICLLVAFLMGCIVSSGEGVTWTSTPQYLPVSGNRLIVVISDLHLGLGRKPDKTWYETEDFRWENAFRAFLDEISARGNDQVDLVIAGDFLDLWQPPKSIRCEGVSGDPNLGCTVDEMAQMASLVVKAHAPVFADLQSFSRKKENRLHILPGNHDSALLVASVWEPVGNALGSESGRVDFVGGDGIWTSDDGRVVVEHGHQIGSDANRYKDWPNIVRRVGGTDYVVRSWGEQFVQKLFNEEEEQYPIIDNLAPESAGARYRLEDRGLGKTATDLANFLSFNLFQTSLEQKVQILGENDSSKEQPRTVSIPLGRKAGSKLFISALPKDDGFRAMLTDDSEQAMALRKELDALALDEKRLPDANVKMLCDQAAIRDGDLCVPPMLGATIEKTLVPKQWVLLNHVRQRKQKFRKMLFLIYGHTHQLEEAHRPFGSSVQVLNSGAFQRVIDEKSFLQRVKDAKMTPGEGLRQLALEKLPPCYTAILVTYEDHRPNPEVLRWVMEETDATGKFVKPGDASCK